MNDSMMCRALLAIALSMGIPLSYAATDGAENSEGSPLLHGGYVAPMVSYVHSDGRGLSDGIGGVFMLGFRKDFYAVEVGGVYADLDGMQQRGFTINGLLFPLKVLPSMYLTVGAGGLEYGNYPGQNYPGWDKKKVHSHTVNGNAGIGYMLPLNFGRYDFALRAEARYRIGQRYRHEKDADIDYNIPRRFDDVLVNIGLQLPLGIRPPEAPVAETPVEVVQPVAPVDTDGDGVPDDRDQCPDTPAGTQVDDVGCPVPPPCKPPEIGQQADLSGCAVGETIVLRGVNFEFNKATLTLNAKTLLDGVADALVAAPAIQVEVGGHTDSKGSDEYNQELSEARASSVMTYLSERGVDAGRMSAVGYGETQPVADNDTDEGRELNRRVELKIMAGGAAASQPDTSMSSSDDALSGGLTEEAAPADGLTPVSEEAAPADDFAPMSDDTMSAPDDLVPVSEDDTGLDDAGSAAEEFAPDEMTAP